MPRTIKKSNAVYEGTSVEDLPLEIYFQIFSFLDLPSVRKTRLVSKKWKLIVETSRNIRFTCHLTDETLSTAVNCTKTLPYLKIHDFTGKDNHVVSSTRGTGKLFFWADRIHFIGTKINDDEVKKMMKYATGSVKELSFQLCRRATVITVFDTSQSFTALSKLVIGYKSFPTRDHTATLERLASVYNVIALPSLKHFKISYDMDTINELHNQSYTPTLWEVFANYLAIAKVIARYKRSLKIVEIARNELLRTALVLHVETAEIQLNRIHRSQIQKCLDSFDEINLEKLHVTPILDEGVYPWILETSLIRRQRNMKEIYLNKKLCSARLGHQALETVLPRNFEFFTSVKIALTCMGNAPVDLAPFAQCKNLTTLWLVFYLGVRIGPARQNSLHFTNLDRLPRTIKSLHFKSSQQDTIIIHQQSILSREQLRWIIDNLRELESLWLQLVTEEPNEDIVGPPLPADPLPLHNEEQDVQEDNPPAVEEIPPPAAVAQEQEDEEAQEVRQLVNRLNQELNANANVNVDTFRDLISMPKIRDMKFDMLKAGQLAGILEYGADGNPWIVPMGIRVSLEDIREYTEICDAAENIKYSTEMTYFFPFGFVELTVGKSK